MKNGLSLLEEKTPTLIALSAINLPSGIDPRALVLQELDFLRQIGFSKPELLNCLPESIEYGVKYAIKNNLTLDPNAGLVYIKTRNVNTGTKEKAAWSKVMEVQATCNGLLSINYQCGKIIDHKNPVVKKDAAGKVIEVSFEIQKHNQRWETFTFDESDFKRWRAASHKENSRGKDDAATKDYSNPNYRSFNGGIDPEFARAKAIRHGLKKLGTNFNERYATKIQPVVKTVDIPVEVVNAEVTELTEVPDGTTYHVQVHEKVTLPGDNNMDI